MSNFRIVFSHPWLLLLLIPAFALTLIPYFRLSKRYRRTRNRITSLVLHLIVMVLAISVLSGIDFKYDIPNTDNEIILLVDVSDTEEQSRQQRDNLVETILNEGKQADFKIGVITFGFNQNYCVPMTFDLDSVYTQYLESTSPDTTATNIAAALTYAKGLFSSPETGKIVLITDGKETDEEASSVIASLAAQGTQLDVAYIGSTLEGDSVQIVGVKLPSEHVSPDEPCTIEVSVSSKGKADIAIALLDNGELLDPKNDMQTAKLVDGVLKIPFTHTFKENGVHRLEAVLAEDADSWQQNNSYCTYLNMQIFDEILVVERREGESNALISMINADEKYQIDVLNIAETEKVPNTVDALRAYDQIILNNIALADMPERAQEEQFDFLLHQYVKEYGGSVFTVGGNKEDGKTANTYNRDDLGSSYYQQMLPVQAIKYTPPLGVIAVIDISGSMSSPDSVSGRPLIEWAKVGATACLQSMSERDYIGIMTLGDRYSVVQDLTPCTQEEQIKAAVNTIEVGMEGTVFAAAMEHAAEALKIQDGLAKRHTILITDGEPNDAEGDNYMEKAERYFKEDGITCSIIGIGMSPNSASTNKMEALAEAGGGKYYPLTNASDIEKTIYEDLHVPEITEVNHEDYAPTANDPSVPQFKGVEFGTGANKNKLTVKLGGFYGTKLKATQRKF